MGRLSGVDALWDCVPLVCGGDGRSCAGGRLCADRGCARAVLVRGGSLSLGGSQLISPARWCGLLLLVLGVFHSYV